jgi:hypothetical protein
MFNSIVKAVGPRLGMASLTVKNYAPEIYLVGAIGAGVASAVMLAKAHKESDDVFKDVIENIESTREYVDDINEQTEENNRKAEVMDVDVRKKYISRSEEQKMLAPLYMEAIKRGAILYGPAVLMGVSSIALLMASHGVLRGRNRALMSALTLFERGFAEYRKRVVDELGEEADERFYHGAEQRRITTLTKDKDGKSTKKKSTKNHIPEAPTPMIYSRLFDETNMNWSSDSEMSEYFLRAVQQQMNDTFYIQGYVLLNTIYKSLGFAESPEGAVVGWSKKVPGDDFISFGLDNDINQRPGDNRWLLDFNVNGVVFEQIGEK